MEAPNQLLGSATLGELRRNTADGRVGGVCVMLADRWRVDPLLVRVVAILLALSSGLGLVLYAAAWLMTPAQGTDRAPIEHVFPGVRRVGCRTGIVLLVAACILAASALGGLLPFGVGPALVLGAVWYFGWYRPSHDREAAETQTLPTLAGGPFSQPTPFTEAAAVWQERVLAYHDTNNASAPAGEAARPVAEPEFGPEPARARLRTPRTPDPGYSPEAFLSHPDPVGLYADDPGAGADEGTDQERPAGKSPALGGRPRRRTGRMHLIGWALTLAAVAIVAILDASLRVPISAYPAAILLAVGVSLIIGAWLPRPRGLVAASVLLAVLVSALSAPIPDSLRTTDAPTTMAELQRPVEHEVGDHVADLSGVPLTADATYAARLDVGTLTIVVPDNVNVRVDWAVEGGEARVLGLPEEYGADLADTTVSRAPDPDSPTLTVEAHVGLGILEVRR